MSAVPAILRRAADIVENGRLLGFDAIVQAVREIDADANTFGQALDAAYCIGPPPRKENEPRRSLRELIIATYRHAADTIESKE